MPIKVKSRYKNSQQKNAVELGDVADIVSQNWETIMGFRPSLKPYGADPHNPPDVNLNNAPLPTEEDSLKPDQGDLAGNSDYQMSAEKENPPHQDESVDHINSNSEQKTTSRTTAATSTMNSEEEMEQAMNDYREKWAVANQIADIKIAADQWKENDRYQQVDSLSQKHSLNDLQEKLEDNRQMLGKISSSQQKKQTKNAQIPHGYSTSKQSNQSENPLGDILNDLGEGYF